MQTKTGYAIFAKTGCSCDSCKEEFFIELFFTDDVIVAMNDAENYAKNGRLKSQYSNTGIYYIKEFEYVALEDGRKIIGNYITDLDYSDYSSIILDNQDSIFLDYKTNWTTLTTYGRLT
jgi:hypothetical protein